MLAENSTATIAADRVGYESTSQFSREYSRMFGFQGMLEIPSSDREKAIELWNFSGDIVFNLE